MKQTTLFVNAGNNLGGGVKLYGWASYQNRDAQVGRLTSAAPCRTSNITSIYPDGFLPIIAPRVDDYSAAGGFTWTAGRVGLRRVARLRQERDAVRHHRTR